MSALCAPFTAAVCASLRQNLNQIVRCAGLLSEPQAWARPNDHCNSVANLVLHLTGNVRQWMLGGLAGRPVERARQAEFDARGPAPLGPPLADLQQTVGQACDVIRACDAAALERVYVIQGYRVNGIVAIYHVGEHFSFHTGQIIHITKAILGVDLSLYDQGGQRGAPESVWE